MGTVLNYILLFGAAIGITFWLGPTEGLVAFCFIIATEVGSMVIKEDAHATWQAQRKNFKWYGIGFFVVALVGILFATGAFTVHQFDRAISETIEKNPDFELVVPDTMVIVTVILFALTLWGLVAAIKFVKRLFQPATPPPTSASTPTTPAP